MGRPAGNRPLVLDRPSGADCERWGADVACAAGLAEAALRTRLGDACQRSTVDEVACGDALGALIVAVRDLAVALLGHAVDGWSWREVEMALASVDARREAVKGIDAASILPAFEHPDVKDEALRAMCGVMGPGA